MGKWRTNILPWDDARDRLRLNQEERRVAYRLNSTQQLKKNRGCWRGDGAEQKEIFKKETEKKRAERPRMGIERLTLRNCVGVGQCVLSGSPPETCGMLFWTDHVMRTFGSSKEVPQCYSLSIVVYYEECWKVAVGGCWDDVDIWNYVFIEIFYISGTIEKRKAC